MLALFVVAIAVGALAVSARAADDATVKVWFLQGEQVVAVERPG